MYDKCVVINQYKILSHIGSGSFGNVYKAEHIKNGNLVALKIPIDSEQRDNQKWIVEEVKIYDKISNPEKGICNVKIIQKKDKKIIVMDLLGDSLNTLINQYKKFGLKTVVLVGIEMIKIIKYIHSKGYLHRDLKPDNFTIGSISNEINKIYCIDFGLAKKFLQSNGNQIPEIQNAYKFLGTARYASITAHKGSTQSPKDDLEALGYLLIYFYKGKLPWQNLRYRNKEKRNNMIMKLKMETPREKLCSGLPPEFLTFFKYIDSLEYSETPRYDSIIKMFEKLYISRGYTDKQLEWEVDKMNSTNI